MFGYNWIVHNLRVATVEMDNFAQELSSKIEAEYLQEVPVTVREPARDMAGKPEIQVQPLAAQPQPAAPTDETQVEPGEDQPDLLPPETEVQS